MRCWRIFHVLHSREVLAWSVAASRAGRFRLTLRVPASHHLSFPMLLNQTENELP